MYEITHFARQSPEPGGVWISVGFVTKDERGTYRFGTEDIRHFSEEEIAEHANKGPLVRVTNKAELPNNKAIWLEGTVESARVWMADRNSPIDDASKTLLWEGRLFENLNY